VGDLLDRLESESRRQYLGSAASCHSLLIEAAAEIRRLTLLTGQPDIDHCDEVIRLRGELAAARMDGLPNSPHSGQLVALAAAWRPEWVDGLGMEEER
jgi:hypothetical protein